MKKKKIKRYVFVKTFESSVHSDVEDLLKRHTEEMAGGMAAARDQEIRDILTAGTSIQYAGGFFGPVRRISLLEKLRSKVRTIRHALANWIGGDELHLYCGD